MARSTRRKLKQGQIDHLYKYTYEELKFLKDNDGLIPRGEYLITDYVTKHRIPGTNVIYTNTFVEPLVITAITESTFSNDVKSSIYPNHNIRYSFSSSLCEDNITPRPGMILSRHDPDKRSFVGCDYLGVKSRRWKIIDKVYRLGAKVDETNVTVTVPGNLPSLSNRTRYEVKFPLITHSSGSITLTIQYDNGTIIKPLRIYTNNNDAIPINYLSEKKGTLIYNPTLDSFVLMDFADIGSELIGTYSSTSSSTFSVGHGISYEVDPNDFEDVSIFNNNYDEVHIPTNHLDLGNDNYYPNVVFRGSVWRFSVESYINKVTFLNTMNRITVGESISSSVFIDQHHDMVVAKSINNALIAKSVGGFGVINHRFYNLDNVTITPIHNMHMLASVSNMSIIFQAGSNFLSTATMSDSNIFVGGLNVGGSVPNNFYITAPLYRTLIGYVSSVSWNINKTLNNQIIFDRINTSSIGENILGATKVETLNIDNLQLSTGSVKNIGIDGKGQVINLPMFTDLPDGLMSVGVVNNVGNNIDVFDVFWRIDNNYYNQEESFFSIPVPIAGNTRIDLIVADTNNTLQLIQGTPATLPNAATAPAVPANTIVVLEVFSTDAGVQSVEQSALSSFVRFDTPDQDLTDTQKANALTNIEAPSRTKSSIITSPSWTFKDWGNIDKLVWDKGTGTGNGSKLTLLNITGDRVFRIYAEAPQAGLNNANPRFLLQGVGVGTRALVTWLDGNKAPIFGMTDDGVSQFSKHAPIHPDALNANQSATLGQLQNINASDVNASLQEVLKVGNIGSYGVNDVEGFGNSIIRFESEHDTLFLSKSRSLNIDYSHFGGSRKDTTSSGFDLGFLGYSGTTDVLHLRLTHNNNATFLAKSSTGEFTIYTGGSTVGNALGSNEFRNGKISGSDAVNADEFTTLGQLNSTVSGTQNYLSKFNATGKILGNSQIIDDGSFIGIGTAGPIIPVDILKEGTLVTVDSNTTDFRDILGIRNNVGKGITLGSNTTSSTSYIRTNYNGDHLAFILRSGGINTEKIRLSNSGNLLIGNINGTDKLDVNGTARIRVVNNATGDVLHISATGVVTKRTLAELKDDLGINTKIDGSGTLNYLPKFTPDGNTIGDSQIKDDGSVVEVGLPSTVLNPIVFPKLAVTVDSDSIQALQLQNKNAGTSGEMRFIAAANDNSYFAFSQPSTTNTSTGFFGVAKGSGSFLFNNGGARNIYIGTREISSVNIGTNNIVRLEVLSDGNLRLNNVNNSTGDILHILANGIVTRRTVNELGTDLGLDNKADLDVVISSKSTNYTLTQADNGQIVEVSATATITLPNGLSTGFNCEIVNTGTGVITLSATTTLRNGTANKINDQHKGASVYHVGAGVWQAIGTEV